MQQFNGNMVNDNIMGTISGLVRYKSHLAGKLHHEINRFTKSSGICYECKHEHKFGLATRTFTCESCGTQQCRAVGQPTANKFNDSKHDIKKKRPPYSIRRSITVTSVCVSMVVIMTVHVSSLLLSHQ